MNSYLLEGGGYALAMSSSEKGQKLLGTSVPLELPEFTQLSREVPSYATVSECVRKAGTQPKA